MNSASDAARYEVRLEGARAWIWLASWSFWLLVLSAAVGLLAHKLLVHREQMSAGRRAWHLRYEICTHLSAAPRPSWQECLVRAGEPDSDLIGAHTPGFDGP